MKCKHRLSSLVLTLLICCTITTFYAQSSTEHHKLGNEKDRNGNFKGAIKQYPKALDLDPYNIEILEKIVFAKSNNSKI
jgi:Flp pilus assembly protein TadD